MQAMILCLGYFNFPSVQEKTTCPTWLIPTRSVGDVDVWNKTFETLANVGCLYKIVQTH